MIDELRLCRKALSQDEVRENLPQSEPAAVTSANELSTFWGKTKALK
jgi:hypothetical protein